MKYRDKNGVLHDFDIIKGMSAYDSAKVGGYTGTEEQFYADLGKMATTDNLDDLKTEIEEELESYKSEFVGTDNVKTINGESIIGKGNIVVSGGDKFVYVKNILDVSAKTDGFYTTCSVGGALEKTANADYSYVVFEVEPNKIYTINSYNFLGSSFSWFLDENEKGIISMKNVKADDSMFQKFDGDTCYVKTPSNAKYFCVCNKTVDIANTIVADGLTKKINRLTQTAEYPFNSVIESFAVDNVKDGTNYIYVNKLGSDEFGDGSRNKPYATIYHANEVIKDNCSTRRYTIIVAQGTYTDLQTRYSGVSATNYQGIMCKDYVYYESEDISRPDLTVISWDGAVGFGTPTSNDVFGKCPFHINTNSTQMSLHTHIKGFTFDCVNTRYGLHQECSGWVNELECLVKTCIIKFHGRSGVSNPIASAEYSAVGCGAGANVKMKFENVDFVCDGADYPNKAFYVHTNDDHSKANIKFGYVYEFDRCNFNGLPIALNVASSGNSIYLTKNVGIVRNCTTPSSYENQDTVGNAIWIKEGTNVND